MAVDSVELILLEVTLAQDHGPWGHGGTGYRVSFDSLSVSLLPSYLLSYHYQLSLSFDRIRYEYIKYKIHIHLYDMRYDLMMIVIY